MQVFEENNLSEISFYLYFNYCNTNNTFFMVYLLFTGKIMEDNAMCG